MSDALLRVCYHCGQPTPGTHAPACRDFGSGVVTVTKPTPPFIVDGLRAEVAALTAERDRLRDELDKWRADIEQYGRVKAEHLITLAERDRLREQRDMRLMATTYERTAWLHDTGQHRDAENPVMFCPRCEIEHPNGRLAVALAERDTALASLAEAREQTAQMRAELAQYRSLGTAAQPVAMTLVDGTITVGAALDAGAAAGGEGET